MTSAEREDAKQGLNELLNLLKTALRDEQQTIEEIDSILRSDAELSKLLLTEAINKA